MKHFYRYIASVMCSLLLCQVAVGETVYLRSGAHLSGTIVFQNEEVVVIKDATGARYQYLMSDVERISADDPVEEVKEAVAVAKPKRVTASLQFTAGGTVLAGNGGGTVGGDLLVGTANLLDRRIFLGGGIGYHADIVGGRTVSTLPIQLRAEIPFMQGVHAPMIGAGVGYGVSLTKAAKGGIFADLAFGWRYQMAHSRALFLGAFASVQGAQLTITETFDDMDYTGPASRSFARFGLRLALYL